jgi:hypothetical protein
MDLVFVERDEMKEDPRRSALKDTSLKIFSLEFL